MTSYYKEERDIIKECLMGFDFNVSLSEKIKNKDYFGMIRGIQKYKDNFYGIVPLSELLGFLIWLFSDVDPTSCQELIEEATLWLNLNLLGINFSLIELNDQDYSKFDSFVDCTINKLRFHGKPKDRTSTDYAESYLTLFERSTVEDLILIVDKSKTGISVDDFKRDIEGKLEENSVPKNIKVEIR